jgi:DNA (cytosine-5)-methyltransferase 1
MLKVFDCFSGYGGAEFALKKAGIEHECVGFSEIDKYAVQCFQQNHCVPEIIVGKKVEVWYTPQNFGDITKIDWQNVPDFDFLTGGFPCQDISQAGKQDLSKGRSILVFELIKALKEKQPKYFLFENVAAIQQEKFKEFLRKAENEMKRAGYQVFRLCLNSKDFGIPQSRQRVWFIGFRKDIAKPFGYNPYPIETGCKLKLKDVLEPIVDKKYYLSEKAMLFLQKRTIENKKENRGLGAIFNPTVSSTIDGRYGALRNAGETYVSCAVRTRENNPCLEIGNQNANSISSVQKDSMILDLSHLRQEGKPREYKYTVPNINTGQGGNHLPFLQQQHSIRRLTPKECFRLQGFLNDEINLEGISDNQKYKLAGNGWEINVVSLIFKKMFEQKKEAKENE